MRSKRITYIYNSIHSAGVTMSPVDAKRYSAKVIKTNVKKGRLLLIYQTGC